jgi:P pilus assembly chaperone PapD
MIISPCSNHVGSRSTLASVFALLLMIQFSFQAHAQPAPRMGISPDRYQITFDERGGETQSLLVQNLSDEPLSLTLSVSNWLLNEENQIVVAPPSESSLDQWIVINPLKVTIPPGSPQTIRWAVMPRLKPEPGEYRAIIFIEEDLGQEVKLAGSTEIKMKMRYGLPIYAQVGTPEENAQLHDLSIARTGERLNMSLSNEGNVHARMSGNYGIWPTAEFPGTRKALQLLRDINPANQAEADFIVGTMPGTVLLPDSRRNVPLNFGIDGTGDYTVQLNARFAQLELTQSLDFTKRLPDDPSTRDQEDFRVATVTAEQPLVGLVE